MSEHPKNQPPAEEEPPWPTGDPDDSEPTPERQTELRAAYESNVAGGRAPYYSIEVRTRGELRWIMQERGWSGEHSVIVGNQSLFRRGGYGARLDLRGAWLRGIDLSFMALAFANLSNADLAYANLMGADMHGSRLSGADLAGANLSRANLTFSWLNNETNVNGIIFDSLTQFGNIRWNDVLLTLVDWSQTTRLGDEAYAKGKLNRLVRIQRYLLVARAYRELANVLQSQGILLPARIYRSRQYQLERKALFWNFKPGQWFFSWLLNIVSGYGDRPGRALACYIGVVTAFAAAYFAITNGLIGFISSHSTRLAWYEALVLSISSFHGRGFFPSVPSLGDPVAIVAAAEAIIGLFIELVFIATFTQRFFAR